MLKHSDIISKLNTLQKIALICSDFSKDVFEQAGVPPIDKKLLSSLGKSDGVCYGEAVRSWNARAVGGMTKELVIKGGEKGGKLFVTPDLKTVVNPYEEGLSEDAYLNGAMGGAIVEGIKRAGGAAALQTPTAGDGQTNYLDREENLPAVRELFVKPFVTASEKGCDAVFADPSREGESYYNVNRTIFAEAQDGLFGDVMVIGNGEVPASGATKLLKGKIALANCALPIERAARRYEQLSNYEKEGSISHRETEESIRDGSAVDEETLDIIADEIIDFAVKLNSLEIADYASAESDEESEEEKEDLTEINQASEDGENSAEEKQDGEKHGGTFWRRRTAAECIVLLKNNGILPLSEGAKIALLGQAYEDTDYLGGKFRIKGTAKGYDAARIRSESYLPAALRAANAADYAVVFLTCDEERKFLALPPNRIALLDALKRGGKQIIAVVLGDLPVDMSFDKYADAVLLAPSDSPFAGEALARVLCGQEDPSGRLTHSLYDNSDAYFRSFRSVRDKGTARIGQFTGYRRYNTVGKMARYPFGFGLSYTKFEYSDLKVNQDGAEFTIKNVGERDGYEVAQMYVGLPDTSHFVPKRVLRAFEKVFLKAGESKRVHFTFDEKTFASYDAMLYSDNVEEGKYALYFGSSLQDIKLKSALSVKGVVRTPIYEQPYDYFPDGNFKDMPEVGETTRLGKKKDLTPEKIKKAKTAATYAIPIMALVFFLLVSTLILSYSVDYVMLTNMEEVMAEWILYVIAVGVLALLPLVGSLNHRRFKRMRTLTAVVSPVLLVVCFVLGGILSAHKGGLAQEIALRIVTCLAIGVPICAVVAVILDRQLYKANAGKNSWDKYYFGRDRAEKITSDEEFEKAFARCEEDNKMRKAEAAAPVSYAPAREIVQLYDGKLSYERLLADLTKYLEEGGTLVDKDALKNYVAAVFSSRFIIVPKDRGAALVGAAAGYFGREVYTDNAESYSSYGDLFSVWRQSEAASYPTDLSVALSRAARERAYLHTVLIRHVSSDKLERLFTPFAEVLAGRRLYLPATGGKQIALPDNLLLVIELEDEEVNIPAEIAEVAAKISVQCESGPIAAARTVLQSVGFETMEAMLRPVRDYFPLDEELWKKVDELDARLENGHIGNRLWLRIETHAAVMCALGCDGEEALDRAIATQLCGWLRSIQGGGEQSLLSLSGVISEVFGEESAKRTLEALKYTQSGEKEGEQE